MLVREGKAVSTILTVLLILVAAILGGFISYMWAIAPFYATPPDVGLSVTGVSFPLDHAGLFYVTVLNPSNSLGGTNITSIYLTAQEKSEIFNVTSTSPSLPSFLDQGDSETFQCSFNWGSYAGENLTVTVFPQSGTGSSFTVPTEFVRLTANAYFNATESVDYFFVTVFNDPLSAINLTLNSVSIDSASVSALSVNLPEVLNISGSLGIQCTYNWEDHSTPDVIIGTQEGYFAEVIQNVSSSVDLRVSDVQFNETNQNQISITLNSSSTSKTLVEVSNITISHGNITDTIDSTNSTPAFPYPVDINSSVTFNCVWSWSEVSLRGISITVMAHTSQGFASQASGFTTPAQVAARIDQVGFDLNDTGHFNVTVTNLPYSLQSVASAINVTEINFKGNIINTSEPILVGQSATLICPFNWSGFLGQEVSVIAHITYANTSTDLAPFQVSVPYFSVLSISFGDFSLGNPYMNVTVRNSEFSSKNANITNIFVQIGNTTRSIDGTLSNPRINSSGYLLGSGNEITIICPWDWSTYVGTGVTVVVQTGDGFQAPMTLIVQ